MQTNYVQLLSSRGLEMATGTITWRCKATESTESTDPNCFAEELGSDFQRSCKLRVQIMVLEILSGLSGKLFESVWHSSSPPPFSLESWKVPWRAHIISQYIIWYVLSFFSEVLCLLSPDSSHWPPVFRVRLHQWCQWSKANKKEGMKLAQQAIVKVRSGLSEMPFVDHRWSLQHSDVMGWFLVIRLTVGSSSNLYRVWYDLYGSIWIYWIYRI